MLKKIQNLENTKILKKETQKNIHGGIRSLCPNQGGYCPNDAAMIPVHCISAVALCCVGNVWVQC